MMISVEERQELYNRQELLGVTHIDEVIVVGVGGTGFWVAFFLALSGVKTLHLFDYDRLELSNLARLPFRIDQVGQLKTEVAREMFTTLRPDLEVCCYGKADTALLRMSLGKMLFDCTDNQKTQMELSIFCEEEGITYIRDGYNGTHLTVGGKASGWSTSEGQHGYTVTPSWVVPAVIAASLGVAKAMMMPELVVSGDLRDIRFGERSGVKIGDAPSRSSYQHVPLTLSNLATNINSLRGGVPLPSPIFAEIIEEETENGNED